MYHEDGIEVSLYHPGEGDESFLYPEIACQLKNDFDNHSMRCFIPYLDAPCQVRVRFTDDFKMWSSSAVHIGIGIGATEPLEMSAETMENEGSEDPRFQMMAYYFNQRSWVEGHIGEDIWGAHRMPPTMPKFDETAGLRYDESQGFALNHRHYRQLVKPGTITVTIQRGHFRWLDEPRRTKHPYGPGNRRTRREKKNGTFRRLKSINGLKYRFEFCPRSDNRLTEIEFALKSRVARHIGSGDQLDQIAARDSHVGRFETIKPMQEVLDGGEDINGSFGSRSDALESGTQIVAAERQQETSLPSESAKKPYKRKRRIPKFCGCPEPHLSAPIARKKADGEQRTTASTPKTKKPNSQQEESDSTFTPQPGKTKAGEDVQAESEVKTCTHCRSIKKPPRGKKVAWRQKDGRWKVVHANAPEETPPEEEGDDDEPSPMPLEVVKPAAKDESEIVVDAAGNVFRVGSQEADITGSSNTSASIEASASIGQLPRDGTDTSIERHETNQAVTRERNPTPGPEARPADLIPQSAVHRPSPILHAEPQPSKARIEIDLLAVEDDDLVEIKAERHAPTKHEADDGEDEIGYQLRQLSREKRMLEIEQKQEELERQQKKLRREKQRDMAVKAEAQVKVEIDLTD